MWLENWFALISASGTTVSKWKHRHSTLYLYYQKFKFQNGNTTKIRLELKRIPHAEPDTSSRPIKTHIVTTWIQTHKSGPTYRPTHYTVEVVTAWTSRPNVSRRCFERLVSVSASCVSFTSTTQCLGLVWSTRYLVRPGLSHCTERERVDVFTWSQTTLNCKISRTK